MNSGHSSDDNGTGSEVGAISNRQRRKQQMQQKHENQEGTDVLSTTTPAEDNVVKTREPDASSGVASDSWAHDKQPPMTGPCIVEYCPTCGMPFEYCEFSDAACAKQKEEELKDASSHAMPSGLQRQQNEQQLSEELQEKAAISDAQRGAGKKGAIKPKLVTVQKQAKRRGKCATNIWGLEHFGVKQEMAAKLASKHFACGSSFQKGQPGQAPFVEIQGDVEHTVAAFLLNNFGIQEGSIVFLPEK